MDSFVAQEGNSENGRLYKLVEKVLLFNHYVLCKFSRKGLDSVEENRATDSEVKIFRDLSVSRTFLFEQRGGICL